MKYLQNTKFLVGMIIILVILIIGGGFFFLYVRNNVAQSANDTSSSSSGQSQEQTVGTMQPSDIGLQMVLRSDNQAIKFTADKLDGIKTLEWNFTYQADIPLQDQSADNAGSKVTQEFGSDSPVNVEGKSSYDSVFRELGTCSSGHCRYDTGITSVQLVMKVTKVDGSVYQISDSINL